MFDFRYHALTIAAVFIALTVGLLLGIAIGDENLVSSAEHDLRASLKADVRLAQSQRDSADERFRLEHKFAQTVYPALVENRLEDKKIGLIAVDQLSDSEITDIRSALAPAGAKIVSVVVVRPKPNLSGLSSVLRSSKYRDLGKSEQINKTFATSIGRQYIRGGSLIKRSSKLLFSASSGKLRNLSGVVIVGSSQKNLDSVFIKALFSGLDDAGRPVVAIEKTSYRNSNIELFKNLGITTVDNLDQTAGQLSLIYSLNGVSGNFGVKSTAGSLLPQLELAQ